MTKWDLSQACKVGLLSDIQSNVPYQKNFKNPYDNLSRCREIIWQYLTPFMIKKNYKTGNRKELPQLLWKNYNTILMVKDQMLYPPRLRTRKGHLLLSLNTVLRGVTREIGQEKETEVIHIGKENINYLYLQIIWSCIWKTLYPLKNY